jgi:hypothetical protein
MTNNRPGRRGAYFFNSAAAAEYLGMSPRTFRRYVCLLDIQPRRMYRRPGKWFTFDDLQRIADVFAPPRHQYVKYLGKRIDACMREIGEIRKIEEKKR